MVPGTKEVVIVIVNGYNLKSPDWEFVVAGDLKKGRIGRIPLAIYIALREEADYMLWNTGASKGVWKGEEFSEAEFSYHYARECFPNWVKAFPAYFDGFFDAQGKGKYLLESQNKHRFERSSTNTLTSAFESVTILDRIIGNKPAKVISVSSRNHDRAGHHFQMVLKQGYGDYGPLRTKALRVAFEVADTGYGNDGGMEFVQIGERSGEDRYNAKTA